MGKGEMGISETRVGEMGTSLFFTKKNHLDRSYNVSALRW